MDRRGRRSALILALAAALAVPAAGGTRLAAQRWLAPGADPRVLARQPAECLARARGEAALSVEIGRAAFRSPTLLGGQAARAGLSCESCHRNGRTNPDFHFPGVSGAPGTADVTASLFSAHRGDGVFNPKPIPDLGGPRDRLKVAREGRALEDFIHGLVTQEFDGAEPPARVLDGLADYVRGLEACAPPPGRLRASDYASDAVRAATAARGALARGDGPAALVLVAAARARLGLVDERYVGVEVVHARLLAADAGLAQAREAIHGGDLAAGSARLRRWLAGTAAWRGPVRRLEARSLFNEERLARS